MYAIDITNLSEDQRGYVSKCLHELMDDPYPFEYGGLKKVRARQIGLVSSGKDGGGMAVSILQDEGYDVSLYLGCGHCLQDLTNTGGRCDCECHSRQEGNL